MPINIMDHIDEGGAFKETFFSEAVPEILGKDFGETKCFEVTPTLAHVIKGYAHGERKIGEKLQNVIEKPAADATDEQKAAFRRQLLTELGAGQSADDYRFDKPQLPEGMPYDQAMDELFAGIFAQVGAPKDIAQRLRGAYIEQSVKEHNARAEAERTAFNKEAEDFAKDFAGDDGIMAMRLAHDALMKFGADDVKDTGGVVVAKSLKSAVKEAGLYGKPTDLEAWRSCGLEPTQLRIWANIGKAMQSGFGVRGQGGAGPAGGEAETVEAKGQRMYTHPDSQRELLNKS